MTSQRQEDFFNVCTNCKISCCQNAKPPITSARKKIIEKYLKEQEIPIKNPFTKTMYTFPREDAGGYCVFYEKQTRKCKIHPVKPETCVAGPITFDINKQTQKIEWYLKWKKICPLAGVLHKNPEILKKHLDSAKKEILKLVHGLEPEALRAILKIEEPETFKIDQNPIESPILNKLLRL
ncbi:MAG: YkgJ family cysteine cluster protein [Candidatus Bathyarchaeota archaeon]|nr:YkgJ family cysteine cluster protein [Candidatus Bathyarchaeota archaeon]MDI6805243.1 YkgJ family cysteine cluster protein [Candidatus Bathyarchaeia archaeon]